MKIPLSTLMKMIGDYGKADNPTAADLGLKPDVYEDLVDDVTAIAEDLSVVEAEVDQGKIKIRIPLNHFVHGRKGWDDKLLHWACDLMELIRQTGPNKYLTYTLNFSPTEDEFKDIDWVFHRLGIPDYFVITHEGPVITLRDSRTTLAQVF
jgi:hypothetical protein